MSTKSNGMELRKLAKEEFVKVNLLSLMSTFTLQIDFNCCSYKFGLLSVINTI